MTMTSLGGSTDGDDQTHSCQGSSKLRYDVDLEAKSAETTLLAATHNRHVFGLGRNLHRSIGAISRPHRVSKMSKTYSSQDSRLVTHDTTGWPIMSLSTPERTGRAASSYLWPYVEVSMQKCNISMILIPSCYGKNLPKCSV